MSLNPADYRARSAVIGSNHSYSTHPTAMAELTTDILIQGLVDGITETPSLPPIINGEAFVCDLGVTEPPQLIEGVLHQGSKLIIGGGSKGRKTWSFMDLALCVSEGIPWWGWPTNQGRVLYLNFELQPFAMQKRMRMMIGHYNDYTGHQVTGQNFDVWNLRGHAAAIETLRPKIKDNLGQYSLVIFDPLYKMLGSRNENDAGDMGSLMNEIEAIAVQQEVSVVIGAHYRKGGPGDGKAMERISGSGVLQRDPDAILTMTDLDDQEDEDDNERECCRIDPVLRNFPPQAPFGLYWNCPVFKHGEWINLEKIKGKGGAAAQFFADDLRGMFKKDGEFTYTEAWKKVVDQLGCGDSTAKKLVKKAEEKGIIKRSALDPKKLLQV